MKKILEKNLYNCSIFKMHLVSFQSGCEPNNMDYLFLLTDIDYTVLVLLDLTDAFDTIDHGERWGSLTRTTARVSRVSL